VIATSHLYERLHPGIRLPVSGVTIPPPRALCILTLRTDILPLPALEIINDRYSGVAGPAPLSVLGSRGRAPSADTDRPAITASSPPVTTSRAAFRPMSNSSYGSAPGSRATNTISTASSLPALAPTRSRTPVGSSLRTSTGSGGATRSPITSAPPLPDDRAAVSSVASIAQTRSRPQTPQPAASPLARRIDSTSDGVAEQKLSIPQGSPSLSSRGLAPARSQQQLANEHERDARQVSPVDTGAVDRMHAAEPSFALALNELSSPTEDDYGFEVTMSNVEEMVDGFEWSALQAELDTLTSLTAKSGAAMKVRSRGAADQLQSRLQDELSALEKVTYRYLLSLSVLNYSSRRISIHSWNQMIVFWQS
jgi:hypothetical protein